MAGRGGARGPVPRRKDQRRRRNKPTPGAQVTTAPAGAAPTVQLLTPDPQWHSIATMYWDAFQESGQTAFYERSDWATLWDVCEEISHYKSSPVGRRNAALRQGIDSILARLMATEGDRRRLRLELSRGDQVDHDEQASVAQLDHYRDALGRS